MAPSISVLKATILSLISVVSSGKLIREDLKTKTLVVLDNWATVESHSMFFDHVRDTLGHNVEFAMHDWDGKVKHLDSYYFDNIIMMSPSTKGK